MSSAGKQLRRLREDAGYTIAHLAQLTGIHPTQLSRIEHEQCGIGPRSAARLRQALGQQIEDIVTPDVAELLGWKDSPLAS